MSSLSNTHRCIKLFHIHCLWRTLDRLFGKMHASCRNAFPPLVSKKGDITLAKLHWRWLDRVFFMPDRSLCDVIYYTVNSCQPLVETDDTKDYRIELMRHSRKVPRDLSTILPVRPSSSKSSSANREKGGISMLPRGTSKVLSDLPRHRTNPSCICHSEPDRVVVLTPTHHTPTLESHHQWG